MPRPGRGERRRGRCLRTGGKPLRMCVQKNAVLCGMVQQHRSVSNCELANANEKNTIFYRQTQEKRDPLREQLVQIGVCGTKERKETLPAPKKWGRERSRPSLLRAAAYAEPLSERRHGCLRTYHKTQKARAEHCSAQAFSHSQRNLWKTQPRGPRSLPRKVMASASGPVLADTTQPSWNTFTGGWPNSFLHCFTSSLTRSPSV